jgi:Fic family protein
VEIEMEELSDRIANLKAELDAMGPLNQSLMAAIRQPYDLELTYTSNAIEGNTLTLRETKEVIEHGITVRGKPLKDHLEAQDHHHAIEYMYELAGGNEAITERTIKELHSLVVKRSQAEIAGLYSPAPRLVSGSATIFPSPLKVPELMEEFGCELANWPATPNASFEAHFQLVRIHPFVDGNGRTARLLMNLLLIRGGYRPIAVRPEDRSEYLDALETASNKDDISPLQALMHRRLADTMAQYVQVLRETHENQRVLKRGRGTGELDLGDESLTPAQMADFQGRKDRGR